MDEWTLHPFQFEGDMFYVTIRDVKKGEEMLTYYGADYASDLLRNQRVAKAPRPDFLRKSVTAEGFSPRLEYHAIYHKIQWYLCACVRL